MCAYRLIYAHIFCCLFFCVVFAKHSERERMRVVCVVVKVASRA